MSPTSFQQANVVFGPPADLDEQQVRRISAYCGVTQGGSCDGVEMVIVAHTPNAQELADLIEGKPIFLTFMGGLPPHFLSTSFEQASNPA